MLPLWYRTTPNVPNILPIGRMAAPTPPRTNLLHDQCKESDINTNTNA